MPFTFNDRQKSVAFFLLTGLFFILVLAILIIQGSDLIAFKQKHYTFFNEAHGFTSGTPIKYKGFNIGKIKSLNLTKENQIRADLYIYKKYTYLVKEDSVLKIQSSLLGAANLIFISSSDPNNGLLKPKTLIYSSDMPEGQDALSRNEIAGKSTDEVTDKVKIILDDLHDLKPSLDQTLASFSGTMYNVNGLVAGLRERKDIEQMTDLLKSTLSELRTLIQTVQKVFGKK